MGKITKLVDDITMIERLQACIQENEREISFLRKIIKSQINEIADLKCRLYILNDKAQISSLYGL